MFLIVFLTSAIVIDFCFMCEEKGDSNSEISAGVHLCLSDELTDDFSLANSRVSVKSFFLPHWLN